ncbi:hypothetical protein [Mycolicibacterium holsaticum]|nr:hypothetical protein [Mycolicibacterium holsaticum]
MGASGAAAGVEEELQRFGDVLWCVDAVWRQRLAGADLDLKNGRNTN